MKNDKFHGEGVLYHKKTNKKFFEGNFVNGFICDDNCVLYDKNGNVLFQGDMYFG